MKQIDTKYNEILAKTDTLEEHAFYIYRCQTTLRQPCLLFVMLLLGQEVNLS